MVHELEKYILSKDLFGQVREHVDVLFNPAISMPVDFSGITFGDCGERPFRWYRFWDMRSRRTVGAAACGAWDCDILRYMVCRLGGMTIELYVLREQPSRIKFLVASEPIGELSSESNSILGSADTFSKTQWILKDRYRDVAVIKKPVLVSGARGLVAESDSGCYPFALAHYGTFQSFLRACLRLMSLCTAKLPYDVDPLIDKRCGLFNDRMTECLYVCMVLSFRMIVFSFGYDGAGG